MQKKENEYRFAEVRRSCKESQQTVAAALGTTVRTLRNWEKSPAGAPIKMLKYYSSHFDASVSYLLGLDSCRTPAASAVSDASGLTEGTIKALREICDKDEQSRTTLNELLSAEQFKTLVSCFTLLRIRVGKMREYIDGSCEPDFFVPIAAAIPDSADFYAFQASVAVSDIANDLYSYKLVLRKYREMMAAGRPIKKQKRHRLKKGDRR